MSLLSNKLQLSNPLLAGTASMKAESSGSLATKRKASSDSQAQQSIPSKQKTGGMSFRSSGSLLLGSSLLGHGKVGGRDEEKAKKVSGLQSSLLGIKSPLMENKLLSSSSASSLTLQNRLLGSSGSSSFGQRLTSSAKPVVSHPYPQQTSTQSTLTQANLASRTSSLLGKQKFHVPADSKRTAPSTSKKIKTQPHQIDQAQDVVIDASLTTCTLPDYNFTRELPVAKLDRLESVPSFDRLDEIGGLNTKVRGGNQIAIKVRNYINKQSFQLNYSLFSRIGN